MPLSQPSSPEAGNRAPRRRWVAVAVATTVMLIGYLLAFGLTRDPRTLATTLDGRAAPRFALRELTSERIVRLRDYRGQVVVVNFWASWCAACRREHPALLEAWERYRDRGMVLLGIVFQDTEENAVEYMAEMGGDWPILLDPDIRTALRYGVAGIPETFIVGPDGTIAHERIGEVDYQMLSSWIQRLLGSDGAKGVDS